MNSLQPVKILDAAYNYNNQVNKFGINVSPNNMNVTEYAATDSSYTSVQINFAPITTLLSNKLLFKYKYRLSITGTAGVGATNLLEPGFFTIEPSIFTQCTNAIIDIDGCGFTVQTGKIIKSLLPYRHVVDAAYQTQPIGGYSDFISTTGTSYSASNTMTDDYIYDCAGTQMYGFQRYLNNFWKVISNSPTNTIIEVNGIVRIPTGVSQYMTDNQEFFLGTKNISLNLNFNNLANTFKYLNAATGSPTITSIQVVDGAGAASVSFLEKPTLRIYTCDFPLPPTKDIYYNTATNYIANQQNFVQNLSAGSSTVLPFNNININNVPNYIYISVFDGNNTNWKTGNALAIDSINVRSDNQALNIYKFDQNDLWEFSKKSNYQFDFNTFHNNTIICLPFSMLVNNNDFYSSASNQTLNFAIDITCRNPSSGQLITNLEANVVFQYDGIMISSLQAGTKSKFFNFVDVNSFINAPIMWTDTCDYKRSKKQLNGGWIGSLISGAISALPAIVSGVQAIGQVAKPIVQKMVCDTVPVNPSGAGLMQSSGGAVMSRSSMRKKLY